MITMLADFSRRDTIPLPFAKVSYGSVEAESVRFGNKRNDPHVLGLVSRPVLVVLSLVTK